MHRERDTLWDLVGLITQLFQAVVLVVSNYKSFILSRIPFNTVSMQIHLPRENLRKLGSVPDKFVTARDLASFIGKASASSRAIQIAQFTTGHYREWSIL